MAILWKNCLKQKQFRELNEAEIMRHLILMGSTFIFSTVENMAAIWRRFMAITFKFSLEAVAEGCLRTASPRRPPSQVNERKTFPF